MHIHDAVRVVGVTTSCIKIRTLVDVPLCRLLVQAVQLQQLVISGLLGECLGLCGRTFKPLLLCVLWLDRTRICEFPVRHAGTSPRAYLQISHPIVVLQMFV